MKQIRKRLTYANVMSSMAVFLVLGGATAFAALSKNSVGPKQLKKNAVTTKKIKNDAVTAAKIKAGAITGAKIAGNAISGDKIAANAVNGEKIAANAVTGDKVANGAITGDKINAASTNFTQLVDRISGNAAIPFTGGQLYPLANPNHTQPAGQTEQYIGGMEVTFAASCVQPRVAVAYLLLDAVNPASPTAPEIIGYGLLEDKNAGQVTRQLTFAPFGAGFGAPWRSAFSSAVPHTFSIFMLGNSCSSGTGVTASGASVDILGTK